MRGETALRVLLATANPHKVAELGEIFAALPGLARRVRLVGLGELGHTIAEPAETGASFEANAIIKARTYARASGMLALADDSGLEVDALEGRPGVISSHYCTDGRETGMTRAERDEANNRRVLSELAGIAPERRGARFVCVMALANEQGEVLHVARGTMEGRIATPGADGPIPRGTHGFGYDPIFLVAPEHRQTGGELLPALKNALSHRGTAARAMAAWMAAAAER